MPESWLEGQQPSAHYNGYCKLGCGMVAAGPLMAVRQQIMDHFLDYHDETAIGQGVHFAIEVSPNRCDVCNTIVEPPLWTRSITPYVVLGDADGLWAVCDVCEVFFQTRNPDGLEEHCIAVVQGQRKMSALDEAATRASIRDTYEALKNATVTQDALDTT